MRPRTAAAIFMAEGEEVKRESIVTSTFSPASTAACVFSGESVISV